MASVTIHWGIVTHRHGTDLFLAASEAELDMQLAGYVNMWANEVPAKDVDEDEGEDHPIRVAVSEGRYKDAIDLYFNDEGHESVETGTQVVNLPEPGASEARGA